jgi:hypothetical protein
MRINNQISYFALLPALALAVHRLCSKGHYLAFIPLNGTNPQRPQVRRSSFLLSQPLFGTQLPDIGVFQGHNNDLSNLPQLLISI